MYFDSGTYAMSIVALIFGIPITLAISYTVIRFAVVHAMESLPKRAEGRAALAAEDAAERERQRVVRERLQAQRGPRP